MRSEFVWQRRKTARRSEPSSGRTTKHEKRDADLTHEFNRGDAEALEDVRSGERVSGKGDLTRRRTVKQNIDEPGELSNDKDLVTGRVLSVHGLHSRVMTHEGQIFDCAIRQVLKSLSMEQRNVVTTGDRVAFRRNSTTDGVIERVEPRSHVISRTSRGRQHVIVANVDRLLIVTSVSQPVLKPGLIDRFLLTAEHFQIAPVVCMNKIDLVSAADYQQIIGTFSQWGYQVLMCSAETGQGIPHLRKLVTDRETAVVGQSGVGKSSLLNAIEPELALRVSEVSTDNQKGRHTTTAARLIPLSSGGFVVDTPGIRQFQLWDIANEEIAGLMPDFRPYVSQCRYSDCLHLNEDNCAIKNAVADARIDARRYDSYARMIEEDLLNSGNPN